MSAAPTGHRVEGPVLSGPVVSVRAEARTTVEPDSAVVSCTVTASRADPPAALGAVADALGRLTAELGLLGGEPLTPATVRSPLTWSARSARTEAEHAAAAKGGQWRPTGRTTATVDLVVAVRDADLLDGVGQALAAGPGLQLNGTRWVVDDDNPAWTLVRADAIRAAVAKGRDYAGALGATLQRIEQVADTGLLARGGDGAGGGTSGPGNLSFRAMSLAGQPAIPSLDPVPQELTATIEARFVTTAVALDAL